MSSYEALLEEYFEEKENANVTFAELGNVLESLTEFANEEITFTLEVTLEEAESETIKDKAAKVGGAVKRGLEALIKKIQAFIEKITDAVKKLVAKAKVTVAQGGNKALVKAVADSKRETTKAIKLTKLKGGEDVGEALLDKAITAITNTSAAINGITFNADVKEVGVDNIIEAFSKKIEKSSLVDEVDVPAGTNVATAYKTNIKSDLESIDGKVTKIANAVKTTTTSYKTATKVLKGMENKEVSGEKLAKISELFSKSMKLNTYAVNYAASLLGILAKNCAKLALAAGGAAVKSGAEKVKTGAKEAPGKIKNAATDAGESIKDTAGKIKSGAKAGLDKAKEKLPKGKKAEEK